ncbi:MIT domain-containing protein 1-like [Liolophura sinensis]|uniref:MIT domain-containing protein 1-like n=1 Tax=Liolophura sinensis TaxID=3198878 RepID=UPI0031588405
MPSIKVVHTMTDKAAGVESSAISVLKRAVELDMSKRYDEAMVCYREGLELLLEVLKVTKDEAKKTKFREKIEEYMGRAEQLKTLIDKEKQVDKSHVQIHIDDNSTGHSYESLFGRCLDSSLTQVTVEDPYIRSTHQIYNFLRFCEVLITSKCPVKTISLTTGQDDDYDSQRQQSQRLAFITKSLKNYGIDLKLDYSTTLHDREIRFNNGWTVKIGRGLDYFKATENQFCVGFCNYDLRACHETTVDIFHQSHTKM